MSKLSVLKQEAYQAGKKRDWDRAVSLYEQILDLDKNNPTLINELGDLCLKAGALPRGVKHFLSAAAKYRQSGLLNNAVAIYKKILRYDQDNLNAHWYLAESRASQGLLVEGENHALVFLSNGESLSGDIKEIFLKRCEKLFELYPESRPILENLMQVFRMWTMPLETGRTQIQLATQMWGTEDQEKAIDLVEEALSISPELLNYPEYARWNELQAPGGGNSPVSEYGAVDLAAEPVASPDPEPVEEPEAPVESVVDPFAPVADSVPDPVPDPVPEPSVPVSPTPPAAETSFAEVSIPEADDTSFADLAVPDSKPEPASPTLDEPVAEEPDDSGCFNLDMDEGASLDDLLQQAAAGVTPEESVEPEAATDELEIGSPFSVPGEEEPAEEEISGSSLLDQILAEDSDGPWKQPEKELETITEEIGAQMGGIANEDDPASLYEMGMVYLEMGLHDQACESFQKASCHKDYAVRAHEMWGITLQRVQKFDEAIAVLTDGLDIPAEGSREYLGLLYHIAQTHEKAQQSAEAQRLYLMIHEQDPGFLDVRQRLSKLSNLV